MQIADQKAVTIHYTLKDEAGETSSTARAGREPLNYLQGAGNIVAGLEKALAGKAAGDTMQVTLAPEEAYGVSATRRIRNVPLRKISVGRQAGARRALQSPDVGRCLSWRS